MYIPVSICERRRTYAGKILLIKMGCRSGIMERHESYGRYCWESWARSHLAIAAKAKAPDRHDMSIYYVYTYNGLFANVQHIPIP